MITASYLPSLQLRRLAVKDVAGLDAFGKHPYGPIEHALDVTRYLRTAPKGREVIHLVLERLGNIISTKRHESGSGLVEGQGSTLTYKCLLLTNSSLMVMYRPWLRARALPPQRRW